MEPDLKNNPKIQEFKDQGAMAKSYLELQSLLGNEKVALPKDENDTVAIDMLNKALGVPDTAEAYELPDPKPPEGLENMAFGMDQFKALAHKHKLTPAQAKGIQGDYVEMLTGIHTELSTSFTAEVTKSAQELKKEWGLAYDSKIKTAQNVMNKFAGSKEAFEHINAKIGADPIAMRMLATVGDQFKEGSLGNIGEPATSFTKTPSEAKAEHDKIMADPNDVYWTGVRNKNIIPESQRKERVAYVESLLAMSLAGQAKK
jgi:hypothetical protein